MVAGVRIPLKEDVALLDFLAILDQQVGAIRQFETGADAPLGVDHVGFTGAVATGDYFRAVRPIDRFDIDRA